MAAARFAPGWRMSLFFVLLLPVLLGLGAWQLDRAAEKRGYLSAYLDRQGMLPAALAPGTEPLPFERVRVRGRYEGERQFLLDNQVRDGRVGYWVVTSFLAETGERWLVNRGWVAAPQRRSELPAVDIDAGLVEISAVAWPDMGLPPLLAEDPWPGSWPKRVQRLNVARMAQHLDAARPLQLRLEAGQAGVLAPAPLEVTVRPEKHTGYAVQWFALAGVLLVAFICYGFGVTITGRRAQSPEDRATTASRSGGND